MTTLAKALNIAKIAAFVSLAVIATENTAQSAEIKFLCAGALESTVRDLIPEFQKTSGYNVNATFAAINVITERVQKGEAADLAIVSPQQWEDLQKDRKIDPAVRVVIAKVGFGVFVKKGAAKPDISSVEAFKRAFLNASSIALFDPVLRGPTPVFGTRLFEQLGMSPGLNPKSKFAGGPVALFELVAKGDAEIGLAQISEILAAPGVELVGSLPADIQGFTIFTTAVPSNAKEPVAAKTLVEFLASARVTALLKSKGLEPN